PSPGLDRAADYIAAHFRRAGLQAVGDDGYFQTATWVQTVRNTKDFSLTIQYKDETFKAKPDEVSFSFTNALTLTNASLVKVKFSNSANDLGNLKRAEIEGNVVFTELPDLQRLDRAARLEAIQAEWTFNAVMQSLKAAMILSINRNGTAGTGFNP